MLIAGSRIINYYNNMIVYNVTLLRYSSRYKYFHIFVKHVVANLRQIMKIKE